MVEELVQPVFAFVSLDSQGRVVRKKLLAPTTVQETVCVGTEGVRVMRVMRVPIVLIPSHGLISRV